MGFLIWHRWIGGKDDREESFSKTFNFFFQEKKKKLSTVRLCTLSTKWQDLPLFFHFKKPLQSSIDFLWWFWFGARAEDGKYKSMFRNDCMVNGGVEDGVGSKFCWLPFTASCRIVTFRKCGGASVVAEDDIIVRYELRSLFLFWLRLNLGAKNKQNQLRYGRNKS